MDAAFLDITGDLDGFTVWLDDERLVTKPTWAEATAAYRAAQDLATKARADLTRTLERA